MRIARTAAVACLAALGLSGCTVYATPYVSPYVYDPDPVVVVAPPLGLYGPIHRDYGWRGSEWRHRRHW